MADVDLCSREANAALCGDLHRHAENISKIDDALRLRIFRKKDLAEIERILSEYREYAISTIRTKFYADKTAEIKLKETSNDNKKLADAFCILEDGSRLDIELKFGAKTDHAIGMEKFAEIFETEIFSEVASQKARKYWKQLFVREYPDEKPQKKRLAEALNVAAEKFNQIENKFLSESGQKVLEETLLNNSGTSRQSAQYIIFEHDGKNLVYREPFETGRGKWQIEKIKPIKHDGERINIVVFNAETGIKIRFLYNFKNNEPLRQLGIKAEAKLGLGSPSWNVWIYRGENKI